MKRLGFRRPSWLSHSCSASSPPTGGRTLQSHARAVLTKVGAYDISTWRRPLATSSLSFDEMRALRALAPAEAGSVDRLNAKLTLGNVHHRVQRGSSTSACIGEFFSCDCRTLRRGARVKSASLPWCGKRVERGAESLTVAGNGG
jgi:hypothetical protein